MVTKIFFQICHKVTNCFVPEYGGENFQVPRYLIKHFNLSKVVWDTVIVLLILYTAFAMPILMSFDVEVGESDVLN